MVAKIKSGKSLKGALTYNEKKVLAGTAVLLEASGYHEGAAELTFQEKLFRLQDLAERNQRVRTHTLHVSLNFDIGENLPSDVLISIAGRYMDGIGFSGQPFLVYQHFDAGHPHIHLLSTNIDRDGQRISLHNLGRTKSEITRKAIESEFNLRKGQDAKVMPTAKMAPIRYGETDSKRAIANIVRSVADQYRFTSIPELNAVLQQYNVLADTGSKRSVMHKHAGLRYWITDGSGVKLGVPIKASSLAGKPTMKRLEQRFLLNATLRRSFKEQVRSKVEQAIGQSANISSLQKALGQVGIHSVVRRTDTGLIYGFTVVDNELKTVFNGSDLGKAYSAAAIASRLGDSSIDGKEIAAKNSSSKLERQRCPESDLIQFESVMDVLLAPTLEHPALPGDLARRKKKKRRLKL